MKSYPVAFSFILLAFSPCLSEGIDPCHEYQDSLAEISQREKGDRWDLVEILRWSLDDLKKLPNGDLPSIARILKREHQEVKGFQGIRMNPGHERLESFCMESVVLVRARDISRHLKNIDIALGKSELDTLASCLTNLKELQKQLDIHRRFLKTVNVGDILKWLQTATPQDIDKLLDAMSKAGGGNLEHSVLDPLLREVAKRAKTDSAYYRLLNITLRKELERIRLEEILETALHNDKRFNEIVDAMHSKGLTGDIVREVLDRSDDKAFVSVMHDLVRERNMKILENVLASKRLAARLLEDSAAMAEMAEKFAEQIRKNMRTLNKKAGAVGIIPPLALQYTPELATKWEAPLLAVLHAGLEGSGINAVPLTRLQHFELMREELLDSLRNLGRGGSVDQGMLGRIKGLFEPGQEMLAMVQADYWPAGADSIVLRLRWIDLGTGLILGTGKEGVGFSEITHLVARGWMDSLRKSANSQAAARIYLEGLATRHIIILDKQSSQILQFGKSPVAYADLGGLSGLRVAEISKISFEPWLGGVSGVESYKEYHATLEQRLRSFRPDRLVFVTSTKTGNDQIRLSVNADPDKKGNVLITGKVNIVDLFSISVECPTDSQWQARKSETEMAARYHMVNAAVLTMLSAYLDITVRESPFQWTLWYGLVPLGIPHLVNGFTAEDNLNKSLYFATGAALGAADIALAYYFWNQILVRDKGDYVRTRHELNMRSMEGLAWGTLVGVARLASLATYIWFDEREAKLPSRLAGEFRVEEERVNLGVAYRF